jgi:hypothetical protein
VIFDPYGIVRSRRNVQQSTSDFGGFDGWLRDLMEAFRTLSMFDWLLDEHSMYDDALISFESFFASWELMQELELDSLKSDFVPETKKKKD